MSSNPPAEARIFVSYNRQDAAITRRFVTSLERAGARVWVDWEGARDGDFLRRINQGLAACDWLALVETPHSLASDPVEMEVNAALNLVRLGRLQSVVPFLAAPCDMSLVPPMWATLHYYDGVKDYQGALAGLSRALDLDAQAANAAAAQPLVPNAPSPAAAAPAQFPPAGPSPSPSTTPGYRPPSPSYPLPGGAQPPGAAYGAGMGGPASGAAFGPTVPPGYAAPRVYPPVGGYGAPMQPMAPQQPMPLGPAPMQPQRAYNAPLAVPDPLAWQAILSAGLGAFGLLAWFIPICGFPVTVAALIFGYLGQRSPSRRTWAIIGMVLAVIGLVLTIANAAIGGYIGFTRATQ